MANQRRTSGRRADLRWTRGSAAILGQTTAGVFGNSTIITTSERSETIMRTRGEILVWLDASGSVAGDILRWAAGFLIQQEGQTPASTPIADGEAPFFWYETGTLAAETAVGNVGAPSEMARIVVDSKAMRILRPNQEVEFIYEVVDVVGAPISNASINARFLLAD